MKRDQMKKNIDDAYDKASRYSRLAVRWNAVVAVGIALAGAATAAAAGLMLSGEAGSAASPAKPIWAGPGAMMIYGLITAGLTTLKESLQLGDKAGHFKKRKRAIGTISVVFDAENEDTFPCKLAGRLVQLAKDDPEGAIAKLPPIP